MDLLGRAAFSQKSTAPKQKAIATGGVAAMHAVPVPDGLDRFFFALKRIIARLAFETETCIRSQRNLGTCGHDPRAAAA